MVYKKALQILLGTIFLLSFSFRVAFADSPKPFLDLPENPLYKSYIETFQRENVIVGDGSTLYRNLRPLDLLQRDEFAKVVTLIYLLEEAQEKGEVENWRNLDIGTYTSKTYRELAPYSSPAPGAPHFTDIYDWASGTCSSGCPWNTEFVNYVAAKGIVKGYTDKNGNQYFDPENKILRIHALKLTMAENGNLPASSDTRYKRLQNQFKQSGKSSPKCLKGAENYILRQVTPLGKNPSTDLDAQNLLAYASLADDLGIFGEQCEMFKESNANTPEERANFLQGPVRRQEIARYLAFTTKYLPLAADPGSVIIENNVNTVSDTEEQDEVTPEDIVDKNCSIANENILYAIESIEGNAMRFNSRSGESEVKITIRNASGQGTNTPKAEWTDDCKFTLEKVEEWRTAKNESRHKRGFKNSDDIGPLEILEGETASIDPSAQTATFNLRVKSSGKDRMMDQFHVNGKGPTQNGVYGIYLYGESPKVSEAVRSFKTSIENTVIRNQPLNEAGVVKTIPDANSAINVTGHAVIGEYNDEYKTYMWYPVEKDGINGFVVASILYADWINLEYFKECTWSRDRDQNFGIDHIILHSSGGGGTASGVADNLTCLKAHYYLDRDGNIVQTYYDFELAHHAGYDGTKYHPNIETWHNENSIGIEIINNGTYTKKDDENWYNGDNILIKKPDPVHVNSLNDSIVKVWQSDHNYVWAGGSDGKGKTSENWEKFEEAKQLPTIKKLLKYLTERFDLPYQTFEYNIPHEALSDKKYSKYGYYYFPSDTAEVLSNGIKELEIKNYYEQFNSFKGIINHHNATGKYDTGPALDFSSSIFNLIND